MIQRIQTVFLIIATMLLIFVVSFPIAEFVRHSDQAILELGFKGLIEEGTNGTADFATLPLSILIALCLAITVFTILLYKKRILQIRLSVVNIILLIGLEGLMYYYVRAAQLALPASVSYKLFFIFPLVAAILVFLALRAIARDEALIRSLDRLR
jgi:hypothetical protein